MAYTIDSPAEIVTLRMSHSQLMNPSTECVRLFVKFCGVDNPPRIRKSLIALASQSRLPVIPTPRPGSGTVIVNVEHAGEYLNATIAQFQLGDWICGAATWRELIR